MIYAGDVTTGRYVTVSDTAIASQSNPLLGTLSITFPDSVVTVGNAMSYILDNTSYTLIPASSRPKNLAALLNKELPVVDRHMGPITVANALLALAGDEYLLLVDQQHRYVSFSLQPKFQRLY